MEPRQHLPQGMLGEAPEVLRLVVEREEHRHLNDHHSSRAEGPVDPLEGSLKVVHVLEHVEAEDHVELAPEFHGRGVHDGVPEARVGVGLNELIGWIEQGPHRVTLLAEVLPSAPELQYPLSLYLPGQTTHVPVHPAPVADEGMSDASHQSVHQEGPRPKGVDGAGAVTRIIDAPIIV